MPLNSRTQFFSERRATFELTPNSVCSEFLSNIVVQKRKWLTILSTVTFLRTGSTQIKDLKEI